MAEARGEVQEIVDTCDFFLGEGRRLYGQTVPSEMRDKQLFTFRVPVGVAGIITAGNFPVAVPSWYLVPALLCGNAVVWKPADYAAAPRRRADPHLPRRRPAARRPEHRARRRPDDLRGPAARARAGPGEQDRLHRLVRGRRPHRRALRPPPAERLPRARRQEPARRHARRRPRPRRRGRAVLRLRHRRAALHLARRRDRARRRPRRLPGEVPGSRGGRGRRRPDRPVGALRPDARRALPRRLREVARRGAAAPRAARRVRPHHRRQPAAGLRRRPGRRASTPTRRS